MYDEDLDALAAEYVLGTLASDERTHAEALIAVDSGFAEIVRQWERRLGELNVMVEAVDPPAEVWEKIKSGIGTVPPAEDVRLAPVQPSSPPLMVPAKAAAEVEAEAETEAESEAKAKAEGEAAPLLAALASTLAAEGEEKAEAEAMPEGKLPPAFSLPPPSAVTAPPSQRSADVLALGRRVRRWRSLAVAAGALAAALAAVIVVSQVDPGLIPPGGFHIPQLFAQSATPTAPAAPSGSRLVAVLQQEPSAPAFLLTIDPASRTLTVRTVAATAQPGHSYELWLIAPNSKPLSLGVVGGGEYTQRPLPANFDSGTVRASTYAISFEPTGGSKTGAPSGPILFTGKLVESVPPPPSPKT